MPDPALLSRTPVLNRAQEIVGYDFRVSKGAGQTDVLKLLGDPSSAESFFGRLPNRFVMTDLTQVDADAVAKSAAGRLILEIDPQNAEMLPIAKKYRAAGFGVCLSHPNASSTPPEALDVASMFALSCKELNGQLEKTGSQLRKHNAKQMAVDVDAPATFTEAHKAGCDFFRGYHFTKFTGEEKSQAISPGYTTIVNLMQLAQKNAPAAKIEETLKRDAALSFKLLRYINSAGFGLQCEITSFKHAVAVLGYQNLYRWLALLMVTAARQSTAPALLVTAIARGRMAEMIGAELFEAQERDNLFIIGAFSLLDVILKAPLDSIVEQIPLADTIIDALFRREGPYGPILSIVEAAEKFGDAAQRSKALEVGGLLGISASQLNQAQVESMAWAEGISH